MTDERINRNRERFGFPPITYHEINGERFQVDECDLESPHPPHVWDYDGMRLGCPGVVATIAAIDAMGRAVFASLGIACEP